MQYYFHIRKAAERDYVAVTVDYQLIKEMENDKVKYPFPAQIHDVKCAVRWLRANAKKDKIDPNRIGVIGYSSGGHNMPVDDNVWNFLDEHLKGD
jgi:acetyl esterase/lipase